MDDQLPYELERLLNSPIRLKMSNPKDKSTLVVTILNDTISIGPYGNYDRLMVESNGYPVIFGRERGILEFEIDGLKYSVSSDYETVSTTYTHDVPWAVYSQRQNELDL